MCEANRPSYTRLSAKLALRRRGSQSLPSGRACHFERSREISPGLLQIHFYHSLSVAIVWRCLGNARSCSHCIRLYWRAARHDRGEGWRRAPSGESMSFRPSEAEGRARGEISLGTASDTFLPLREACAALRAPSERLKQTNLSRAATKVTACEGEFAFRAERTNLHLSLAQNRGFCAKEEPQAIKQASRVYSACCEVSFAATRRNLPGYASDTLFTTMRRISPHIEAALARPYRAPNGAYRVAEGNISIILSTP